MDNNETLKDIVAEMRGEKGFPVPFAPMRGIWLNDYHALADRIEAAAERDRSDAIKTAMMCKCEICKEVQGNKATMREALEWIVDKANGFADNVDIPAIASGLATSVRSLARAALAAPARNCDRFATAGEAMDAFFEEEAHADGETLFAQVLNWLFAPAEGGAE